MEFPNLCLSYMANDGGLTSPQGAHDASVHGTKAGLACLGIAAPLRALSPGTITATAGEMGMGEYRNEPFQLLSASPLGRAGPESPAMAFGQVAMAQSPTPAASPTASPSATPEPRPPSRNPCALWQARRRSREPVGPRPSPPPATRRRTPVVPAARATVSGPPTPLAKQFFAGAQKKWSC